MAWTQRIRILGRRRTDGGDPLSLLASIADTLDEAVIGLASDGMVVLWNAAAESLCGRNAAEVLGSRVTECVPKDHRKELDHLLGQALGERRTVLWYGRLLGKGGEPVPAWITLCPIWDEMERVRGAVMVVRQPRGAAAPRSAVRARAPASALPHGSLDPFEASVDDVLRSAGADAWSWPGADKESHLAGRFPYHEWPPRGPAGETPGEMGEIFRGWSGFRGFFLN